MLYTTPDYFEKFKCLAGDCPDTCCAGWQVMIDEASLKKYRKVKGSFGNRLKNSIRWKEKCFDQCNGRCAFLNEKNLCDIQIESGEDLLCETCRSYPRHVEEFEDMREIGLALSCPAAAKLILENEERVTFLTTEKEEEQEEYEEFDYFLFSNLEDARTLMLQIIQNRGMNYRIRMAMVLAFAHDLQNCMKHGNLCDIGELLNRYQKPDAPERFAKKLAPYCNRPKDAEMYTKEMFQVFSQLEVLSPRWPSRVGYAKRNLFECSHEKKPQSPQNMALYWEQLMVYFVFTYFCGAVYDSDAFSKIKFAVASTMLILEMDKVYDDIETVARAYAKEVEHSQQNLETMEWNMNHNPAFFFERLLVCIMNR